MQSYRLQSFGSIEHLQRVEEDIPEPGRNQLLIKVRACSLNYRDLALLYGTGTLSPQAGLIPLSDGSGEVVMAGAAVTRFSVGDRVAGSFFPYWTAGDLTEAAGRAAYGTQSDGWLTQYKVVDEASLVKFPAYLSFAQAATLPCAAVTAWNSLMKSRQLRAGETVLTQGTGGVALFAVQLAKIMGLMVISLTSNAEKARLLTSLGADHIVNYLDHPDWFRQVREITDGEGVQRIVEVGGPATLENSLRACAAGGEIALLGFVAQGAQPIDFFTLFKSGATIRPFSVGSRQDFEQMNRALSFSRLQPVISHVFDFDDALEAWRYFDRRLHTGKVVIAVN
ncbi:NAD(P)-dependent alcohol dehydrogenase [Affinibrenneria salicis]|uniref:NAD(P)-dependent alcohol dehydrogenase n=1 Tax=Affinibrenneria salicis TaxID=2590031 RepID=A0A5J5G0W8_9GAMM|nr:NAD(P)-dependent alcohol dehydrogenase [Affinibrenneria salicis]KAA9000125.1 NAD(P)-dependent alcohol dehydrogenase [Affinibrenneria salicis]